MGLKRMYILDNSLWDHHLREAPHCPANIFGPFGKLKGYAWMAQPYEGYGNIVYATTPGKSRNVFNALLDWLDFSKWTTYQFDKWIEVRPVNSQLYQSVIGQKQELQARIKQALISISQSVSDLELLEHDIRKYEEFKKYLDDMKIDLSKVKDPKKKKELEKKKKLAEMAIKAVFVDQVDYHAGGTGQGPGRLSMAFMRNNNIMPTIVDDFMIMKGPEDLEEGPLKNLQTVEKNMLRIKWKAYEEWLNTFRKEVEKRLDRLNQLRRSRERTLKQFREWAKPLIARELSIKEGISENLGDIELLKGTPYMSLGEPTSVTFVNVLAFNRLSIVEYQKTPSELYEMEKEKIPELENIYDDIAKILIFDEMVGLKVKYPWITPQWVDSVKGWCMSQVKAQMLGGFSRYIMASNIRFITRNTIYKGNFEVEIGVYLLDNFMITPNLMFVKMVEYKAREAEIERYINEMLGLTGKKKKLVYTVRNGKYIVQKVEEKKEKEIPDTDEFDSYDDMLRKYSPEEYEIEFSPQKEGEISKTLKRTKNLLNLDFDFLIHLFPTHGEEYKASDYSEYIYSKFKKVKGFKRFFTSTPYEKDFFDRMAQFHMVNVGISAGMMRGVIKKAMGVPGV